MRAVARYDHDRALAVCTWPLVEVLHAYLDYARRSALQQYRHAVSVWIVNAPWRKKKIDPPALPDILKDD